MISATCHKIANHFLCERITVIHTMLPKHNHNIPCGDLYPPYSFQNIPSLHLISCILVLDTHKLVLKNVDVKGETTGPRCCKHTISESQYMANTSTTTETISCSGVLNLKIFLMNVCPQTNLEENQ